MTTGAYLHPASKEVYPRNLTLPGFIQTVLVGLSGLDGTLVRAKAQPNPPKAPDLPVNWLAFEVNTSQGDFNPHLELDANGNTQFQRQETLQIATTFYGPDALGISNLVRDGFEIAQNRYWLKQADMGFVEMSQALRVPDLVNERWVNRYERTITLRHQVKRSYPVPTLVSANGQVHSIVGNEDYLLNWVTPTS